MRLSDIGSNLALDPMYKNLVARMEKLLLAQVNYPAVSLNVAKYNIDMAKWWVNTEPKWKCILNGTCGQGSRGQKTLNDDWG